MGFKIQSENIFLWQICSFYQANLQRFLKYLSPISSDLVAEVRQISQSNLFKISNWDLSINRKLIYHTWLLKFCFSWILFLIKLGILDFSINPKLFYQTVLQFFSMKYNFNRIGYWNISINQELFYQTWLMSFFEYLILVL